ncbi:MAG: cell division protein FtsZ [Candidatus Nitrotoga sp.]|jgi:cell division protein FtsZ|nr:cell division protein FtsZ [Candidatus Nitrotoga sp.]MCX7188644.1 cell division protein FtsZ [Pseudomonadota bacterium]MBA0902576.1 cell division protein FtsZ [Candidatus Nitrotoga sp.]MBP0116786.1 cell division protein FtsZ [Candidatus Nitrotoga sp.]MBP0118035.1 cell division protein FtsZ [Candidatus Nitrotoga sp.]
MFEIENAQLQDAVIKVIGVGGCGGNAVDHMIEKGVQGVEFIVINTDAQALNRNKARTQLQIGATITKGLGAGAIPDVGRAAAEEDRERIADLIRGANMVFITAGMGGGTGTGAAPVVAQIAKEMDVLTVAVVTKPFIHEGKRMRLAQVGIEALSKSVDSLIIVPNEKLMTVLGEDTSLLDAFSASNSVLQGAVAGIAEVINVPGLMNVDFADVRTLMSENGMAMMGSATASGSDRAKVAAERAMSSPLLEDVNLAGARGVLINISSSNKLTLREFREITNSVQFAIEEATVIVGSVFDESMGDELRVTIVATGLNSPLDRKQAKPELVYGQRTGTDNEPLIEVNYEVPAVMRNGRHREAVEAMRQSGVDTLDIPSFLRKQAD